MSTKAFLTLLVAMLVLGGGVGGAIVGVAALSNGQDEAASPTTLPAASSTSETETSQDEPGEAGLPQPSEQVQAGEPDQETSAQPSEQAQVGEPDQETSPDPQIGQRPGGQAFEGGDRLAGTIQEIEGGTITINSQQGLLQATVGPDTTIQTFGEGTLADLEIGLQVRVVGQLGEAGTFEAQSLVVTPEGGGGFFGGGFADAGGQFDQFRQQFQSGDLSQEDLDELRQQFQDQFGQGGFGGGGFAGGGFGGRGGGFGGGTDGGIGLMGTLETIEGNTVTVNTSQGPLQATITPDTTIQVFTEGTLADLQTGMRVTVVGGREEDGTVRASSFFITPEGAGFFGGGSAGGRSRPGEGR